MTYSFSSKLVLVVVLFVAAVLWSPRSVLADASFCSPFQNCFRDSDCTQGYCENRVCKCDADPGYCAQRCPDFGMQYASPDACGPGNGGVTVHHPIGPCRGAGARPRYGGGILSYCNKCTPTPPPPTPTPTPPSVPPCTSPNTCAFTSATCSLAIGSARDADGAPVTVNIYEGAALIATGPANPNFSIALPLATPVGPLKANHLLAAYAVDRFPAGGAAGPSVNIFSDQTAVCLPPPPTVTLPTPAPIPYLGTAVVSWNAPTASSCNATGGSTGWAGARAKSGNFQTLPLTMTTVFGMSCINDGGTGPAANVTVTVQPPLAPVITGITQPDYCSSATLSATITWSAQTNNDFQVQAARDSLFNFLTYDSKNPLVQATQPWWKRLLHWFGVGDEAQAATGSQTIPSSKLAYGQKYYVRVRVRDNPAAPWSLWSSNVFVAPGTLTSFTTPSIAYPTIKLSVTPAQPLAKQEATFSDDTDYKGDAIINRTWDFGDGTVVTEPPPPISGNTMKHTYANEASVTAVLSVQTASMPVNKPCKSAPLMLNIGKAIPIFKEVRP